MKLRRPWGEFIISVPGMIGFAFAWYPKPRQAQEFSPPKAFVPTISCIGIWGSQGEIYYPKYVRYVWPGRSLRKSIAGGAPQGKYNAERRPPSQIRV